MKLKYAIDGRTKPAAGIRVETAKEAAAVLSGLCHLMYSHVRTTGKNLCDTIARQTNIQAAHTLDKSDVFQQMPYVTLRMEEPEKSFAQEMVLQLENYKENYIGLDNLTKRYSTDKTRRSGRN